MKFVDIQRTEFKRLGVLRRLGRPVPDARPRLRGGDRARARRRSRAAAALSRQEAGALVPARPDRARRGRDRVRGPHARRRSTCGSRSMRSGEARPRLAASRPRSSSGRRPRGRCRRTSRSSRNPEFDYVASRARRAASMLIVARRTCAEAFGKAIGIDVAGAARSHPRDELRDARGRALPPPVPRTPARDRGLPAVVRRLRDARGRHRPRAHRARATAPTTTSTGASTACRRTRRSTTRPLHRGRPRDLGRADVVRGRTRRSSRASPTTRLPAQPAGETIRHSTRTAGAARTRSSFAPPRSGSRDRRRRRRGVAARNARSAEIDQHDVDPGVGRRTASTAMIENRPDWCCRASACGARRSRRSLHRAAATRATSSADVMEHVADDLREGRRRRVVDAAGDGARAGRHACRRAAAARRSRRRRTSSTSGSSRACRGRAMADGKLVPTRTTKVDLYLEGTDQHRGWFHSSLLDRRSATRGQAPYKAVLTHGFVLDEHGKPYSKSEIEKARAAGTKIDYVEPDDRDREERRRAVPPVGRADRLPERHRLLADDPRPARRVVPQAPQHRRFLLRTSTTSSRRAIALEDHDLRELDLLALGVLRERDHQVVRGLPALRVPRGRAPADRLRHHRCRPSTSTRSRTRSTARRPASPARRSVQTALYEMVRTLATWMAPILCFTAAGRRRRARHARPARPSTCTPRCASSRRSRARA